MLNVSMTSDTDPYWTRSGNIAIRTMPARSLAEFASGECAPMYIVVEDGTWALVDVATNERCEHGSRQAAMEAADAQAKELLDSRDARMLAEAGLSDDEWQFCNQGRFLWFQSTQDGSIRLERNMGKGWTVVHDRETIGFAKEPADAAEIAYERMLWKRRLA